MHPYNRDLRSLLFIYYCKISVSTTRQLSQYVYDNSYDLQSAEFYLHVGVVGI